MATKKLKQEIIKELKKLGFGKEKAEYLLEKHIDVVEANEDELTPKQLAMEVEEQYMQGYD